MRDTERALHRLEASISSPNHPLPPSLWKYRLAKVALFLLTGLRQIALFFVGIGQSIGRVLSPVTKKCALIFFLPIYRIVAFQRLRLNKAIASTRGFLFVAFTSRYTLHVVVGVMTIPAILLQLQAKTATADVGRQSILYSLVTNGQAAYIQESADDVTPASRVALGSFGDALTPVPAIDYDFEDEGPLADAGLPGSLAWQDHALPTEDAPTIPETPIAEAPTTPTTPTTPTPSTGPRGIVAYTIRSGDTLASIAQRNGVNVASILWANGLTARSIIRPGDTLRIPPVSGVIHTVKKGETLSKIASLYSVDASAIQKANSLGASSLTVGQEIVVPGGEPLVSTPIARTPPKPATPTPTPTPTTPTQPTEAPTPKTPKVTSRSGVRADIPIARIRNKAFDVYQELKNPNEDTRVIPPDKEEPEEGRVTKLLWPTKRYVINQYYGWNHTGVDIDGDYTDPIYASEDGTVAQAGWNSGGYGLQIVIDHDGGLRTRYAHASKLFVKAGDTVKRGQVIAMVGTTGRSTGTHLHYEVYLNGKRKNPLTYTK